MHSYKQTVLMLIISAYWSTSLAGMEVAAQLSTVPSLRSLALNRIAHLMTSDELTQERYIALARQLKKTYIPDEIMIDLLAALQTKQHSYAITTCFEHSYYPINLCWNNIKFFVKPSTNQLCLPLLETLHIIDTVTLQETVCYKPSSKIRINRLIAWHPTRSLLALAITKRNGEKRQEKTVIISEKGTKKHSFEPYFMSASDRGKIAWAYDEHAIKMPAHSFSTQRPPTSQGSRPFAQQFCDCGSTCIQTIPSYDNRFVAFLVQERKKIRLLMKKDTLFDAAWPLEFITKGYFSMHIVDTQLQTHTITRLPKTEQRGSLVKMYTLEWLGTSHRIMVYTHVADICIFECPTMINILDLKPAEYQCIPDEKPAYNACGDQLYCKRWAVDRSGTPKLKAGLEIIDLSLITQHSPILLHDRLLGWLAMTQRYRALPQNKRDEIRFEKDITDPILKRKIKSALKQGTFSLHAQGD